MSDLAKQVGALIRKARKEQQLTQKELGEKMGVSESMVNKLEAGRNNFTVDTLQKIADVLQIDITTLFT